MAVRCPSLGFYQAIQERTRGQKATFEKLGFRRIVEAPHAVPRPRAGAVARGGSRPKVDAAGPVDGVVYGYGLDGSRRIACRRG